MDVSHKKAHENFKVVYVPNMARPKTSMVEGYIWDGYFGFIIQYLHKFYVVKWCIWDVDERHVGEVLEGIGCKFHTSPTLHDLAH